MILEDGMNTIVGKAISNGDTLEYESVFTSECCTLSGKRGACPKAQSKKEDGRVSLHRWMLLFRL